MPVFIAQIANNCCCSDDKGRLKSNNKGLKTGITSCSSWLIHPLLHVSQAVLILSTADPRIAHREAGTTCAKTSVLACSRFPESSPNTLQIPVVAKASISGCMGY